MAYLFSMMGGLAKTQKEERGAKPELKPFLLPDYGTGSTFSTRFSISLF